jgi:hypothetical protein
MDYAKQKFGDNYSVFIKEFYRKKMMLGNPNAYYKFDDDNYFIDVHKNLLSNKELETIFKTSVFDIDMSSIKFSNLINEKLGLNNNVYVIKEV